MPNQPAVRSLAQSSRYVCLSCRLRHPTLLYGSQRPRTFASKPNDKDDEIVSAHRTKSHSKPASAGPKDSAAKRGKSAEVIQGDKAIKPAAKAIASAKTAAAQAKNAARASQRKKSTAAAGDSEDTSLPTGDSSNPSLEDDWIVNGSTGDAAAGKPKKQLGRKRKSSKTDVSEGSSERAAISAEKAKGLLKAAKKKAKAALKSVESMERSEHPGKANKMSPRILKIHRLKIRKVQVRNMKEYRKIAAQLRMQNQSPVRKVNTPFDISPVYLESEKSRVERLKKGESISPNPVRKRRPGPRHSFQASSISAAGVSIKDAMKGSSLKNDEDLPRMKGNEVALEVIPVPQPPVPKLAHGLNRVLFNPGVYHVRDPRTRTYNFDPHLEKLMPVREFNFDSLNIFTPPSKDATLADIAKKSAKKYVASTSSLTGVLKHFHYLLSQWRPINFDMLTKAFPTLLTSFTRLNRAPDAIFLRWKDGVYAVDSDKFYDSANVLSLMGRYMEKLLTVEKEGFMRHKVDSTNPITENERAEPEAYHYSTLGDFVLRSQLDAHDARLPGTGIFDLKTRAVVPIRMDSADYEWGMEYEIRSIAGEWQSFEREYHDMIRSTMLKYSLQVRMGRMDGIFIAFHNIARIFGFQYISLEEMDHALHGQWNRTLGDQEFLLSLRLINEVFNKATEQFPEQSIRFHFETRPSKTELPFMYIFAEPVTEEQVEGIQTANKHKIEEWEQSMLHGAPTERGQEKKEKLAQGGRDADEKMVEDAAYNIDQDVTSEFMPDNGEKRKSEPASTLKDLRENEYAGSKDANAATAESILQGDDSFKPKEETTDSEARHLTEEETPAPKPSGPLAAYVLTINNRVNGNNVTRPRNPHTEKDDWEMTYSLVSIANQDRAWTLYNMCKARREKELGEEKKNNRDNDYFKNMLKRITADGKRWRKRVDDNEQRERDEGRGAKFVWNEKAHTDGVSADEKPGKSSLWERWFGSK